MITIVRHGQSQTNVSKICGSWVDCPLTEKGIGQAREIAHLLKDNNIHIDSCYSSCLDRAIQTREIILNELNLKNKIPIKQTWRLNETHSGDFTGYNIQKVEEKYGKGCFVKFLSGYDVKPPPIEEDNPYSPKNYSFYNNVENIEEIPRGESLKDSWERAEDFWINEIEKDLKENKNVLVVCHGGIIRAIMKHCEKLSDEETANRRILLNCMGLNYTFKNNEYINRRFLADPEIQKSFTVVHEKNDCTITDKGVI